MSGFDPNKINYQVYLEGEEVQNVLIQLSVSTTVNKIPRARIQFDYKKLMHKGGSTEDIDLIKANGFDHRPKKTADFMPGKEIQIKLGRGQDSEEVFIGLITKKSIVAANSGNIVLTIDCKHNANRMTLNKRTRFLHHDANSGASSKDNIDTVDDLESLKFLIEDSADYGLKLDFQGDTSSVGDHENMMQYNCSDWDFLVVRTEAINLICLPEEDKIKLISPKTKDNADAILELGKDLLEYEAEYNQAEQSEYNTLASWDIENQKMRDASYKTPLIEPSDELVQTPNYIIHGGDIADKETDLFMANQVSRNILGVTTGVAKVKGTVKIKVGQTIELKGFKSVWDRNVFVSGISHVLRGGNWITSIQCGLSNESHIEKYNVHTLAEQEMMPKTSGLLYGIVKQYKISESGHELIEVELTAYNENDDAGGEPKKTIYARLANLSAGKNGGAVFRPYPEDEVVVGFVNNDPRFPVVLGAMYNSNNQPPFEYEDFETQYEVGFSINDWKISIHEDDKTLSIQTPKGQSIVLEDDDNITLTYDSKNTMVINEKGIEINAETFIVKCNNEIDLDGDSVKIKAGKAGIKVEGLQVEIEGKTKTEIKGSIIKMN